MTWPAEVLDALDRDAGTLVVVRLTTARGVALLSDAPATLTGPGLQVYPYVSRWGEVNYTASSPTGNLESVTFDFTFEDPGRDIEGLVGELAGAACDLLLHTTATAWSVAPLLFSGVVSTAPWAGGVVSVRARVRDDALQALIPPGRITRNAYPNLPDDSASTGQAQAFVIGLLSSLGYSGDRGMMAAPLCDRLLHDYLLGVGRLNPLAVYSGGVRKVQGTDWELVVLIGRDARLASFVRFIEDQGDAVVTWDGYGLTSNGQVGGPIIDNPALALKFFLNNAVFGDWRRGEYLTGAPLSEPHFAQLGAFLSALGHKASYYADSEPRAGSVSLEQFLSSFNVCAFWTADGLLAVAPLDHRTQGDAVYLGSGAPDIATRGALTLYADAMAQEPASSYDANRRVQEVEVRAGFAPYTGRYSHSRPVKVGNAGTAQERECMWLPSNPQSGEFVIDLQPDSVTEYDYTLFGAATPQECIQAEGDDKWLITANASAPATRLVWSSFACPDFVQIKWLEVVVRIRAGGGVPGPSPVDFAQIGLQYSGIDYPSGGTWSQANAQVVNVPTPWQYYSFRWHNPPHAPTQSWTTALVDAYLGVLYYKPSGDRINVDLAAIRVSGTPTSEAFAPTVLSVGSLVVHRDAQPLEQLRADGLPLRYASVELLERVPLVWPRRGWRDVWYERPTYVVVGRSLDIGQRTVALTLEPVDDYLATLSLDARATVDALPYAISLGVKFVTAGGAIATAGGPTTVEGVGEEPEVGPLVNTLVGSWPSGRRGLACHGARANLLPDPCFFRGTLGWAITPGANGATVTADPALDLQLYGSPADAGNVLSFVAGAPHTTASTAVSTATAAVPGGAALVAQVWYRDFGLTAADALAWRLQRAIDGWWWHEASRAWQASVVDNPLPLAPRWARFASRRIGAGASATALALTLAQPAGGAAGHRSIVGHAEIDALPWAGPPIPGAATPGTSAARTATLANDCPGGVFTMPPERFCWRAVVRPWWYGADLDPGMVRTAWSMAYDASNSWAVAYVAGAGWRFRARAAGANYDAVVEGPAGPPERFAPVTVEVSATSAAGEFEAPLLLMVRVTDSAGSASATAPYVAPTYAPGALLCFGSAGAADHLEGDIVTLDNSPRPRDLR